MSGRLAEFFVGRRDIEKIVDDLEGHAKRVAERGERIDLRAREAGDDRANATRGAQQRCGLAIDGAQVRVFGALQIERVLQFKNLPFAQLGDGGGEQSRNFGAQRRGDLRCFRQ